ncbi:autotransporter-associated beta strand repeat-containing protein, partial [Desulfococcaceae bacterium OttesenSCG-928-F15]|nr:autotransporter-associated beta strand repeat-containing protein [Desulfococcaceae bacterium OttesenSCG-928-F15]
VDTERLASWTGAKGSTWNETEANWDIGTTSYKVFKKGDSVEFDGTGGGTITVAEGMSVSTMEVTGGTYTFSGSGISSSGAFKNTGGDVTFNVANHFASASLTGGTTTLNHADGLGGVDVSMSGGTLGLANALNFAKKVELAGSNGVAVADGAAATMSGIISGAGSLTKTGGGDLTLSGANSYTGGTSIEVGGGLTVTGTLGTGTYAGAIANAGSLTFDQTADQMLSGAISGGGSFTKRGDGELTLASDATQNSFKLDEGSLKLANGKTLTGGFSAKSGTTLTVNGTNTITGDTSFGNGMNLIVNDPLTTALTINGSLTVVGSFNLNVTGTLANATYTVIEHTAGTYDFTGTFNGKINGEEASSSGVNVRYGSTEFKTDTRGQLNLVISGVDTERQASWTGENGSTWNETDENWDLVGSSYKVFKKGDDVEFTAIGDGAITVADGMSVSTMTVTGGDYTFSGSGISSTGAFKNTGGNVTFNEANSFDAAVLSSGTTIVNHSGGLGNGDVTMDNAILRLNADFFANSINVTGNATIDNGAAVTYSAFITGAGSLTKTGDGELALLNDTNLGAFNLSEGSLKLAEGKTLTGDFSAATGTTLTAGGGNRIAGDASFGSDMNLVAGVTDPSTAALTIGGTLTVGGTFNLNVNLTDTQTNNTYTVIDDGTTNFGGKYTGKVNGKDAGANGPNVRYGTTSFDTATDGLLKLVVSGMDGKRQATWNKTGGGNWNETEENWALASSTENVFKSGDDLVFGGTVGGTIDIDNGTHGDISIGTMRVENTDGEYLFTGQDLATAGAFTKTGDGAVTFQQKNAFTSATLNGGRTNVDVDGALGDGVVTMDGGTLGLNVDAFANAIELAGDGTVDNDSDATLSGDISGTGSITKTGAGGLSLSGTNTYTDGTFVSDGRLIAKNKDALGTGDVETNGSGTLVLDFAGEFENDINGTANVEIAGDGVRVRN